MAVLLELEGGGRPSNPRKMYQVHYILRPENTIYEDRRTIQESEKNEPEERWCAIKNFTKRARP